MKIFLVRSLIAAGLVAGYLLSVNRAGAQELPSAEDILDGAAKAVATRADVDKIKTMVVRGKYTSQGMPMPFAEFRSGTDKTYMELTVEGLGTVERGVNGDVAWEKTTIVGSRVLKAGERA